MGIVNVNYTPSCNSCNKLSAIDPSFNENTIVEQIVNTMISKEAHVTIDIDGNTSYPVDGCVSMDILTKESTTRKMRVVNVVNSDCNIYTEVFEYLWKDMSNFCIGKTQCHEITHISTLGIAVDTVIAVESEYGWHSTEVTTAIEIGWKIICAVTHIPEHKATFDVYNENDVFQFSLDPDTTERSSAPAQSTVLTESYSTKTKFGKVSGTSDSAINTDDITKILAHLYGGETLTTDELAHASCTYGEKNVTILDIVVILRYLYPVSSGIEIPQNLLQAGLNYGASEYGPLIDLAIKGKSYAPMVYNMGLITLLLQWSGKTYYLSQGTTLFVDAPFTISAVNDSVTTYYNFTIPVEMVYGDKFVFVPYVSSDDTGMYFNYGEIVKADGTRYPLTFTPSDTASGVPITLQSTSYYELAAVLAFNAYKWISIDGWKGTVDECSNNLITMLQEEYEKITPKEGYTYSVIYPSGDTLIYHGSTCIKSSITNAGLKIPTSGTEYTYNPVNSLAIPNNMHNTPIHQYITDSTSLSDCEWCNLRLLDFAKGCLRVPKYIGYASSATLRKINIANTVETIGDYAFYDCNSCDISYIPAGYIAVCQYGFYNVGNSLKWTNLPQKLIRIDAFAFFNCTSLTKITIPSIPSGVTVTGGITSSTVIGESAFQNCTATELTIDVSITSIGASAFKGCTAIATIYYTGTTAQWASITKGTDWNNGVPATTVYCSDGSVTIA